MRIGSFLILYGKSQNPQKPWNIYSGHPLSRTLTGLAKKFDIANVRDTGKFEILAFYKALGKSNTVFTSALS